MNELASHNHGTNGDGTAQYRSGGADHYWLKSGVDYFKATANAGGNKAHNNMPAYQTLYAWRRTA